MNYVWFNYYTWNIPEMTRASLGPQTTTPISKHIFNKYQGTPVVLNKALFIFSRSGVN